MGKRDRKQKILKKSWKLVNLVIIRSIIGNKHEIFNKTISHHHTRQQSKRIQSCRRINKLKTFFKKMKSTKIKWVFRGLVRPIGWGWKKEMENHQSCKLVWSAVCLGGERACVEMKGVNERRMRFYADGDATVDEKATIVAKIGWNRKIKVTSKQENRRMNRAEGRFCAFQTKSKVNTKKKNPCSHPVETGENKKQKIITGRERGEMESGQNCGRNTSLCVISWMWFTSLTMREIVRRVKTADWL